MDPSHSSALSSVSQNSHVVSLNALTEEIVAYEKESDDTHAVKNLDALCTPESFVTHSNFDTPGGTVYYIPKVSAAVLLVKGNVYDSVDDCVFIYEVGCLKEYTLDTLDLELEREEYKAFVNDRRGDSDAQMLIHKMENRKKHVSDFSFDYLVDNAELTAIFWADEVSKSESENSFFSHFTNSGSTLMNFMNCFETAMEKQRHVQERMDHKTIDTVPKLKTLLKIERHASNVYTRSLFELSPYVYEMPNKKKKKPQSVDKGNDKADENDKVLRSNANVEIIPQQYILRRWTKNLIPAGLRNKRNIYGEKNVVVENYANEATSIVDHCVHLLSKDEPRLGAFVEKLKSLKKEVEADCPNPPSKNKTDNLEQLVGVPKPTAVDVNNPTVGSTKGRKKMRIKGGKEKAIEKKF
ncbi:protein FAR1-related sequence 5 [Tanacetum coccineum]